MPVDELVSMIACFTCALVVFVVVVAPILYVGRRKRIERW